MPHGYEASANLPAISVLDDDGDGEPRRKKVNRLATRPESRVILTPLVPS